MIDLAESSTVEVNYSPEWSIDIDAITIVGDVEKRAWFNRKHAYWNLVHQVQGQNNPCYTIVAHHSHARTLSLSLFCLQWNSSASEFRTKRNVCINLMINFSSHGLKTHCAFLQSSLYLKYAPNTLDSIVIVQNIRKIPEEVHNMLSVTLRSLSEVFDCSREQSQIDLSTSVKPLFESFISGV